MDTAGSGAPPRPGSESLAPAGRLTAVAAVARNRLIGRQGRMPWHIPEDFARFKRLTMGGALIMGRTTYESIGKPLPGRASIVVSRTPRADLILDQTTTVTWLPSVDQAVQAAVSTGKPAFVVGGAQIYQAAWPYLTDLDITEVAAEPEGDAFFPEIGDDWVETSREPHSGWSFVHYVHA